MLFAGIFYIIKVEVTPTNKGEIEDDSCSAKNKKYRCI